MSPTDFSLDELSDIGAALESAAKATEAELLLKRSEPYKHAIAAQKRRYEMLHAKIVAAVERPNAQPAK